MIRNPAVAGQFYPGPKDVLLKELKTLIGNAAAKVDAIGVVSPHAGYMYSGVVAGSVFSSIKPRSTYIILGPNHTGLGEKFGLSNSQSWKTPLGEVKVNKALADAIKKHSSHIEYDDLSHAHEHSIEVQLPFLQFIKKDFDFVPIAISYADPDVYMNIGKAIADSIIGLKLKHDVMIIASSDMTHYESQASAKKKDGVAIEAILKLDDAGLVDSVSRLDISMCGYAPVAIMIAAAKLLGAKDAKLIKYQTSGDVSGDYSSVVGYAGIVIS